MPKIFEYSYSVHFDIMNIFAFIFDKRYDPEYICIRICISVKKNIRQIFVFVFGPKKRYSLFSVPSEKTFSHFALNRFDIGLA